MNGVISSGEIMLQPSATVTSMNETQNHGLTTIDNDTRRPNEVRQSSISKKSTSIKKNFRLRSGTNHPSVDLKTPPVYMCVQKIPPVYKPNSLA